ncbi:hypothetical protein ISF_01821 [Cordyceps fumosorosea ARSEF 2679]|uniref:DUF2293 domain-containing protein n=1 Tax=Cordyceps fumosorosea (strain ARSEF 2679) TaxID=1081104 RepID=A0A168CE24_CORFA|nr:hypothetical protein ISF_01821 [Cordyceps fumosorosea ARSEF 2679]OAA71270.1 hypothetical protein ISF_01821 [Cordyceps fumosorosea ARSEF 2679]
MVREQRGLPAAVVGGPKERHMRQSRPQFDCSAPVPENFAARPLVPKSKHHTYFEFVANENKKKKLEYETTIKRTPPAGFEFVPIGNPDLTTACKEISREKDAMIFIVSNAKAAPGTTISGQVHRVGHHIRAMIVEEARAKLGHVPQLPAVTTTNGAPEPIPDSQEVYHAQADAALRDLFPRIPNTDRQIIIDHSFTRVRFPPPRLSLANRHIQSVSSKGSGSGPVGLSKDISLARRVQLAVLAHIRHNHTPYDQYLKEVSWENARKLVEQRCLDTLVQWRGDEETGRDQLDEILREVVVISDSETGDSDDESTDATSAEEPDVEPTAAGPASPRLPLPQPGLDITMEQSGQPGRPAGHVQSPDPNQQGSKSQRRNQRGFKRYRAWEEAIRRNRELRGSSSSTAMETDPGPYPTYARQQPLHSAPIMLPIHRPPFGGSAASRSLTPPSHDVPLPSIEPTSPMQPSFVRRIPPQRPMDNQHPEAWNQPPFQTSVPPGRSAPFIVTSGPASQYSVAPPQAPPYPYQPPYGTEVYLHARQVNDAQPPGSNGHFQAELWQAQAQAQVPTPAHRIIMDVNRPGERSNPIVMEDRGGFYERVTQPEEPIHIREVRRWSRPPEPYGNRYFPLRRESPMVQDHEMDGGVELYPVSRETAHAVLPWRPPYQTPLQQAPLAASDHRDHGAIHIRAVSQSPSHAEHQGLFSLPRRDQNQSSWGTARDSQYGHGQARGHGYRSPPIQASPRRHGPRGNVIVLD